MLKIKYKIYTLGCKVNQSDSDQISRKLSGIGFIKVDKNADLAIINSCSVTKTAILKNQRMINRSKIENPNSKIVLTGCWPRVYGTEIGLSDMGLICREQEPEKIVKEIIKKFFTRQDARTGRIVERLVKNKKNKIRFNKNRSRYFLKIQDGCNQYCSYCVIPLARGDLKSKERLEIMEEFKAALNAGYEEIVLCGVHLGLYGKDAVSGGKKIDLAGLLADMIKIKNLGRIRLSSIEVTEVGDSLIKLMAENDKICQHLHMPLQAGSDKILKLMKRPYTTKNFFEKVKKIREKIPDIAITTDVITGFPGESEKDFLATCKFIKKVKFSRLHVFPFSAHEKTLAAKMKKQINGGIKKARAGELRKISKILEDDFKKKFIGQDLDLLIEKKDSQKITGKSQYYFDVQSVFQKNNKIGNIVQRKYEV